MYLFFLKYFSIAFTNILFQEIEKYTTYLYNFVFWNNDLGNNDKTWKVLETSIAF